MKRNNRFTNAEKNGKINIEIYVKKKKGGKKMKLDKIEEKPKKKNKKAIIITVSTAAVLTFSGVAGWMFLKDGNNKEIRKFVQNTISGENTKQTLGNNNLDPATIKSMQSLLGKTGFGYTVNSYDYKYNETTQDMVDKHSISTTSAESLYIMCHPDDTYDYKTVKGSTATRKSRRKTRIYGGFRGKTRIRITYLSSSR